VVVCGAVGVDNALTPERKAELKQRLAELDRRPAESHDGYAPFGLYVLKWALERGELMRELRAAPRTPSGSS